MISKSITIDHTPLGNGQPYFQQFGERIPRMPSCGETVVLTMTAEPKHQVEAAQVRWKTGESSGIAPCTCLGTSDSVGNSPGERYWTAVLPAMEKPGEMTYQFILQTGFGTQYSQQYSYRAGRNTECRLTGVQSLGDHECLLIFEEDLTLNIQTTAHSIQMIWGNEKQSVKPDDQSSGDDLTLKAPWGSASVGLHDFSLAVTDREGRSLLTSVSPPVIREVYSGDQRMLRYVKQEFFSPDDEVFTGFGERYTRINHRGEIIHNRVFEQYKNQRLKTYLPIPFFMTNRNWGCFIHTPRDIRYDLGCTKEQVWSYEAEMNPSETLQCEFFLGSPQEIYRNFTSRFEQPSVPPAWVFGPWMSCNEWNSQKRVLEAAQQTMLHEIPATVLVIEAWSDESTFYIWNDARYEPMGADKIPRLKDFSFPEGGLWSDPKGMTETLKEMGIHLVLWQIPVVKNIADQEHAQQRIDEEHVRTQNYVMRNTDGSPYQVQPGWFRNSMVIDFDDPSAREWWLSRRRYLLEEVGVSGFKTDGGEHLWGYDISSPSGLRGDQVINTFPQSYIASYTKELDQVLGKGKGILFSRSGYLGAYSTPAHWTGDQDSTWEAYQAMISGMIHASISGVLLMGWDIGGFTGEIPSAELYLRSTAAAAFSPVMQYHSEFNHHRQPLADRTPWNIAERTGEKKVIDVYRMYAKLRMDLREYIMGELEWAIAHREPLVRPLFLDAPHDPECWKCADQYLLGRSLLAAPVIKEHERERTLYLPEGSWVDVWSQEIISGGRLITREAPLEIIPVYRRKDAEVNLPDFPSYLMPRE